MARGFGLLIFSLVLCFTSQFVLGYHTEGVRHHNKKMKVTHLHFYLHDILSGNDPSSVEVARSNRADKYFKSPTPFSSIFVIDDPLREGPEPTSKVIGNAQGIYISTGQKALSLFQSLDYTFTTGEFKGSSIIVSSRNPLAETEREVAVVGGRGKFRLARGFGIPKASYFNLTNGDAIVEYNFTIYHP